MIPGVMELLECRLSGWCSSDPSYMFINNSHSTRLQQVEERAGCWYVSADEQPNMVRYLLQEERLCVAQLK